jgi:hypothetical protein
MFFAKFLYEFQMIMPPRYSGLYDPPATTMKQTQDIHFFLIYKSRTILNTKQLVLPKRVFSTAIGALEVTTNSFST